MVLRKIFKKCIHQIVRPMGFDVVAYRSPPTSPKLRPEFQKLVLAGAALQKLLDEYTFQTVLDIGCGTGDHAEILMRNGKLVTAIDLGRSVYFKKNLKPQESIVGDFNAIELNQQFDCVWASHVLEHQLNVGIFLQRIWNCTKMNGVVCITVPPGDPKIIGGHVSFWNAGLLLYRMVLAGFDCAAARILQYDYNISLIVNKTGASLPVLQHDKGDVDRISRFLPPGLTEGFDGEIFSHNW